MASFNKLSTPLAIGAGLLGLALLAGSRKLSPGSLDLANPVPGYPQIDDPFGSDRTNSQGGWRPHNGIDQVAPSGTPIQAVESGRVIKVANQPNSCGHYVIVQHKKNGVDFRSTYCHMLKNSQTVRTGQRVSRGQLLGKVGNTGRSNQPHLHLGIQIKQNGRWTWVDPAPHLPGTHIKSLRRSDFAPSMQDGLSDTDYSLAVESPAPGMVPYTNDLEPAYNDYNDPGMQSADFGLADYGADDFGWDAGWGSDGLGMDDGAYALRPRVAYPPVRPPRQLVYLQGRDGLWYPFWQAV